MIFILIAILIFEVIRLVLYIRDSTNVAKTNKRAEARMNEMVLNEKLQNEEWKQLRKAEIEELKELAKGSEAMRAIFEEMEKLHNQGGAIEN